MIDGPFAETRELVAGYWMWEVKDMAEAVAWVKRCPNPMPGPSEIEIRPVFEMDDFADVLTPGGRRDARRGRDKLEAAERRLGALPAAALLRRAGAAVAADETHQAIEAVFRIERARLDRRPGPNGARRRPGRGAGAGRAGRRARRMAADAAFRTTPAPG